MDSVNDWIKNKDFLLEAAGDCPNVEMPVRRDNFLWEDIRCRDGWVCQKSILSDHARVLSPEGIRKANGSKNAMLEKMDRLADQDFARKGDILGVSRSGFYEHYAIYLGHGRVIHYCGEDGDFGGRSFLQKRPLKGPKAVSGRRITVSSPITASILPCGARQGRRSPAR